MKWTVFEKQSTVSSIEPLFCLGRRLTIKTIQIECHSLGRISNRSRSPTSFVWVAFDQVPLWQDSTYVAQSLHIIGHKGALKVNLNVFKLHYNQLFKNCDMPQEFQFNDPLESLLFHNAWYNHLHMKILSILSSLVLQYPELEHFLFTFTPTSCVS